ncbi:amino acid adenylation domain-containing protein [Streptomyces sp. NPDC057445]|uniref:amino acid adenylation domain-containing protein n=1 Tax=Streptomyces sp. NPDC057445 TaxID=3346136 RepID=UPI003693CE07
MTVAEELFAPLFPADILDEFVLAPAALTPDKPAVVERGPSGRVETVSYRELAQRVEDYAKQLTAAGLHAGDRLIVESHTSSSAIALLLACARLGAAFIPVDPEIPARRLESIIDTTGPVALFHPAGRPGRGPNESLPTATFDADGITFDRTPPARPRRRHKVVGTDTAYIIFTSGTTGLPKGVVMSHRSALAFYRGTQRFGAVSADDRVAGTSPLAFDVALFDICVTLASGATLVVVPRDFLSFPRRLLGFLRQTRATVVHGVPSLWRPLLRHEPEGVAELGEHLRGILFAGENFPLPELHRLRALLPHLRVINAFGATETVACSFAEVPNPLPEDTEILSIGHGYPGAEILLVDEVGEPVGEPGIVGEMYVRCPSLFTGYWNDAAATRAVLVPDPLDPRPGQLVYRSGDLAHRGPSGELYFCGRADSMVKIRGNRIELGEIERRLAEHPAVTAAVALTVTQPDGEPALAAFVVAPSAEVTTAELARLCKQTMPAYMVPKKILFLDELPLTANGKADRTVLAELATAGGAARDSTAGRSAASGNP